MRNLFIAAICGGILPGCDALRLNYPTIPRPADVEGFTRDLSALGTEPAVILSNGFALVDRNCADFFDALQRGRQIGQFGSAQLAAIATAASAVLAIAGAGAPAIGYTAAGLGLSAITLDNVQRFALLTDFPDELQSLVMDAQASFKTNILAQVTAKGLQNTSVGEAYSAVVAYARLCTLPSMRALARDALATARTGATSILTAQQTEALRGISFNLGLTQPLTLAEAGALLRFANSGRDDPDGVQLRALLGDRLVPVYRLPAMTPRNPAAYAAAVANLRLLAANTPSLAEASRAPPTPNVAPAFAPASPDGALPLTTSGGLGAINLPRIRVIR